MGALLLMGAWEATAQGSLFPADAPWNQDISQAPVDGESAAVIAWLDGVGGWGTGRMLVDFSFEVLTADAQTPRYGFVPTANHFLPDCDLEAVPVPAGGALEGESGYECTTGGDCHLIVREEDEGRLYEMWKADVDGGDPDTGTFFGGCLAVWDLELTYPGTGRGADCTSADAAGYPITALLFDADEVASGSIDHAIRFILPNSRIRNRIYVAPATHSTGATSGPATAPPYGARLRLRADYPLETLPNDAARTVARAMQTYGMFLADGGQVALTATSDRSTTAKWSGLLASDALEDLEVTDFEMIEAGPRTFWTGDCVRQDPIFVDGFELPPTGKWATVVP